MPAKSAVLSTVRTITNAELNSKISMDVQNPDLCWHFRRERRSHFKKQAADLEKLPPSSFVNKGMMRTAWCPFSLSESLCFM
jgi:hypothetical protein